MNTAINYFYWQLLLTPKKIISRIKTFLIFGLEFFSVKETILNIFSPWKREIIDYGKGFNIERYIEAITSNIISRVIGFVMRLFLLAFFIVYEIAVLIFGTIILILYTTYPFIAVGLIIISFKYL